MAPGQPGVMVCGPRLLWASLPLAPPPRCCFAAEHWGRGQGGLRPQEPSLSLAQEARGHLLGCSGRCQQLWRPRREALARIFISLSSLWKKYSKVTWSLPLPYVLAQLCQWLLTWTRAAAGVATLPPGPGPLFPAHCTLRETEAAESIAFPSGSPQDVAGLDRVGSTGWTPRHPFPVYPQIPTPVFRVSHVSSGHLSPRNSVPLGSQVWLQGGALDLPSVFT